MRQNKYEYDAFISHAVEDKIPIANELCAKLERAGLKIWYSGKELGVGDSIEKTIEKGLNRSRYGIVIFSPTYLAKNWTIREFYTLLAKEIEEHKVILPVLYNITLDELKNKDLVMADRFAVNADRGMDFIVERLVHEIKRSHPVKRQEAWFSKIWFVLILSLLANIALVLKGTVFSEPVPMVVPVKSVESEHLKGATIHNTFLAEMQGLFKQLNTCSCRLEQDEGQLPVDRTALVQNHGQPFRQTQNSYKRDPAAEKQSPSRQPGSKMTMAVVFQIETAAQTPPDLEQDMDDMLSTISLNDQNDPFIRVTSRENSAHQHKKECAHYNSLGE
jgi:hypothetical protein